MSELRREYGCVAMSSAYLGSVRYYAAMLAAEQCVISSSEQALTHKWEHNHAMICGPNGVQQLVVPIVKTNYNSHTPMCDVMISEHGNWRHLHWGALFSSYGKSPFFDYIADDLHRCIMGGQRYLIDLNMDLHRLVVEFLDLPIASSLEQQVPAQAVDLRGKAGGKLIDERTADVPYYQLWAERTGFVPNLSIIDLLCNEGREAVFTLINMAATNNENLKSTL
ncbi:MAG: WbqC family protein [Muribaculaceae bacterium]